MKMLKTSAVCIALVLGWSVVPGCGLVGSPTWTTTTIGHEYSFEMPGVPTPKKQMQQTASGPVEMLVYAVSAGNDAYAFVTADLPASMPEPKGDEIEQRLDGAQQGAVSNAKGKLLNSKKIKLDGYHGRELTMEVQNKLTLRVRAYLIGRKMISLTVASSPKDSDRFFNSFKLLDKSAKQTAAK